MSLSRLDVAQIQKTTFDEATGSMKVVMQNSEISMELSSSDGDSVLAHPEKLVVSALGVTNADTVIIPAQDASNLKKIQVYCKTAATDASMGTILLQVSPVDSGNEWITIDTVVPSSVLNEYVLSGINDIVCRRIQVIKGTALGASAQLNIHINVQG